MIRQRRATTGRRYRAEEPERKYPAHGVPRPSRTVPQPKEKKLKKEEDSNKKTLQTLANVGGKVGMQLGKMALGKLFGEEQQPPRPEDQQIDPLASLHRPNIDNAMGRFNKLTEQSPEMQETAKNLSNALGFQIAGQQGVSEAPKASDKGTPEQAAEEAQKQEEIKKSAEDFKSKFNEDFKYDNDGSDFFSFGSGDSGGGGGK